jgi:hypothetical protein
VTSARVGGGSRERRTDPRAVAGSLPMTRTFLALLRMTFQNYCSRVGRVCSLPHIERKMQGFCDLTLPYGNVQTERSGRIIVRPRTRGTVMIDSVRDDGSRKMIDLLSWIALIAMLALLTVGGTSLLRSWHDGPAAIQIGPFLKAR